MSISENTEPFVRRPKQGESMNWLRDHASYPHDDYCLIWPFTRKESGYPMPLGRKDGTIVPIRWMCEVRNGPPPTPEHQASHSCGRGHCGCINPCHLSWKTRSENQLDRRLHGTQSVRRTKITAEQAAEIRSMKSLEPPEDTAERFGLREATVRQIQDGKIWRLDRHLHRIFSDDEVAFIRAQAGIRGTPQKLAKQYGVSDAAIRRIQQGRSYKYLPLESPSDKLEDRT